MLQFSSPPSLLILLIYSTIYLSMAVASLETFQLREILSTAALRHPDVLDLLRTSLMIQETHMTTAHQAIYDLLVSQSQEEARIMRLRDERTKRDSIHTYGPSLDAHGTT